MANRDLPPNDSREVWISDVAAAIRRALDDPAVRAEVVTLLCGEEERRQRRGRIGDEATENGIHDAGRRRDRR
jgi:hypothetical protein